MSADLGLMTAMEEKMTRFYYLLPEGSKIRFLYCPKAITFSCCVSENHEKLRMNGVAANIGISRSPVIAPRTIVYLCHVKTAGAVSTMVNGT